MKSFALIAALSLFSCFNSAFAQKSTIEGNVAGSDGRPLKDAQVQIQLLKSKSPAVVIKTDAKGHFVVPGLPVGFYDVKVMVGGAVKSFANGVKTTRDHTVRLQLGGRTAQTAAAAPKKKKHWVYVAPPTGSHIGGGWQEVDDGGPTVDSTPSANNIGNLSKEQLSRFQQGAGGPPTGAGGR